MPHIIRVIFYDVLVHCECPANRLFSRLIWQYLVHNNGSLSPVLQYGSFHEVESTLGIDL